MNTGTLVHADIRRIAAATHRVESMPPQKRRQRRQRALSGGGRAQVMQPVWVEQLGGAHGDKNGPCAYTYRAWAVGADTSNEEAALINDEQPLAARPPAGWMRGQLEGELWLGMAILVQLDSDNEPAWHLWYVPDEVPESPGPCQPCAE